MAKVRIYDLAKELSVSPKELLDVLQTIGVVNKVASSAIEETAARSLRHIINKRNNPLPEPEPEPVKVEVKPVQPASFQKFRPNEFRHRDLHEEENGNGAAEDSGRSRYESAPESRAPEPRAPEPRASESRAPESPRPSVSPSHGSGPAAQPVRPVSQPPLTGSPAAAAPNANPNPAPNAPAQRPPYQGGQGSGPSHGQRPQPGQGGSQGASQRPSSPSGPSHSNGNSSPASGGSGPAPARPDSGNRPAPSGPSGGGSQNRGGYQGRPGGHGQGGGYRPSGPYQGPPSGGAPGQAAPGQAGPGGPGVAGPGAPPQGPGAAPAAGPGPGGFATGPRDRRAMKSGRYRGRNDRTGPRFGDRDFRVEEEARAPLTEEEKKITITGAVTVADLAERLQRPSSELIRKLFTMNIMRAANQPIEFDVAAQLASQYGYSVEVEKPRAETEVEMDDPSVLVPVPPVVVIMGHVDHGKTSLLDTIRQANVQRGEAGGITQRIGAYETEHNGHRMVFLDTPGHEAFTRMRARGAHVTDIAILVVAADDGVMPQTREAIDHARAAKLPIIVAMNKMDKPGADPDRVKGELAAVDLIPEDYGGDIVVIPVSAKTGAGVQDLLDMVLLVSELLDLKANPTGPASGTVIEARLDQQRGPVATVMVNKGTLHVGDQVVSGDVYGRVRAMLDYKGDALEMAGPKTPVFITGLSAVPQTSDSIRVVASSREARETAEKFGEDMREGRQIGTGRTLMDMMAKLQAGGVKELNIIVKADGQGSLEAVTQSLEKLAHEEVRVRIISRGVGKVSESDVMLASASEAIILAFSVGADSAAKAAADREKVEIRPYEVIYAAIDDVKAALEGMLKPVFVEKYAGEAEVRKLFKSTKAGTIAGCMVTEGKVIQGQILRVMRNKRQVFEGKVDSLRHIKAEVKEMVAGQECGISTNGFNDFQEKDVLQCYTREQVKRSIDD